MFCELKEIFEKRTLLEDDEAENDDDDDEEDKDDLECIKLWDTLGPLDLESLVDDELFTIDEKFKVVKKLENQNEYYVYFG